MEYDRHAVYEKAQEYRTASQALTTMNPYSRNFDKAISHLMEQTFDDILVELGPIWNKPFMAFIENNPDKDPLDWVLLSVPSLMEFRYTRYQTNDLSKTTLDPDQENIGGFVYHCGCWIQDNGVDDAVGGARFYLIIGNQQWMSNDLAELEEILYYNHYIYEVL